MGIFAEWFADFYNSRISYERLRVSTKYPVQADGAPIWEPPKFPDEVGMRFESMQEFHAYQRDRRTAIKNGTFPQLVARMREKNATVEY